jgi:hypothetical protein
MGKNIHMRHLEDQCFHDKGDGVKYAIGTIMDVAEILTGSQHISPRITMKWDGAPAIVVGTDPSDGKFFISTKSAFNKTPKIAKTIHEIHRMFPGELAQKLSRAFSKLRYLGITGIVQGDLLFAGHRDFNFETYDNVRYVTFQPNTIVYAVPIDSVLASQLMNAEIGVVFHTSYTGDSIETLEASYGVDVTNYNRGEGVWFNDATVIGLNSQPMSVTDFHLVRTNMMEVKKIFNKIPKRLFGEFERVEKLIPLLEMYVNVVIRSGEQPFVDAHEYNESCYAWLFARGKNEIDSKKTNDGQRVAYWTWNRILAQFTRESIYVEKVFEIQRRLVGAKSILINALETLKPMSTFLRTKDGLKPTASEGYVVSGSNGALKLVNRLEFSRANFSPDAIKGWSGDK